MSLDEVQVSAADFIEALKKQKLVHSAATMTTHVSERSDRDLPARHWSCTSCQKSCSPKFESAFTENPRIIFEHKSSNRPANCHRWYVNCEQEEAVFVLHPHTDFRGAPLGPAIMADFGRSKDGPVFGRFQTVQFKVFVIAGGTITRRHIEIEQRHSNSSYFCLLLKN
jgi:hypothetical protein